MNCTLSPNQQRRGKSATVTILEQIEMSGVDIVERPRQEHLHINRCGKILRRGRDLLHDETVRLTAKSLQECRRAERRVTSTETEESRRGPLRCEIAV
jgi:hypothetical protein